jgi:ATP-dependent RNA helicase RhlE
VATPGRLLDLIEQGQVRLNQVEILVLDEADRMLDMGFIHDVRRILALMPAKRQSLFFSATLAPSVVELAESILTRPARVSIAPATTTAEKIEQRICFVGQANKPKLLAQLLDEQKKASGSPRTLVFSRTKHGANRLALSLTKTGYRAEAIHGNKSQAARLKALDSFRSGRVPVLVATDVAARGIDVKGITLVVNYDLPEEPESYVHRIGRTARAGAEGMAISLCCENELDSLRGIEKVIRQEIPVLAEQPFHDGALADRHANQRHSRGPEASKSGGRRFSRGGNGRPFRQKSFSRSDRRA